MTPKETFTALADALFGEPKGFKLSEREFQGTTILVCNVKRQFYGRIIGGGGKVIQAFQIILGLAGRKAGKSHALQVLELDKEGKAERLPFVPDLNWDGAWLEKLACEVACGIFKGKSYVELDDLPDGTSALRFFTVDKVPLPAAKVSEALGIIFRAIGKANGREVAVEFKVVS
jgi:predicted RNA-binding protein YlqC (UPF0109 family)